VDGAVRILKIIEHMNSKVGDHPENSSPLNRAAILVLGVARSGTSLLAHLLSVLGAALPEQLLGAGQGNPLGHWEPKRLLEINEEILKVIDRTWYDPRPIPNGWFRSSQAYDFQERITREISSLYEDASLILIKEPRICRLAPLYLDALDTLGIQPLVILPIRHPAEVIRSMRGRDGGDMRTHELRWLRHLIEAEEASRDCRRVWTSYDSILEDWRTTMNSVAQELGIAWPNDPERVSAEVEKIVCRRHRHFQFTADPVLLPLGPLTTRAWQAALYGLKRDEISARSMFDEIRTALNEVDRLSLPQQESIESKLETVEKDRLVLEKLLADSKTVADEANQRCAELNLNIQEFRMQISQLHASLGERERDLKHLEEIATQIAPLREYLAERESSCDQLVQQAQSDLLEQVEQAEQLKGRINSIHSSVCWRLTWPIRWVHGFITAARQGRP
jgi:hypothetical protein